MYLFVVVFFNLFQKGKLAIMLVEEPWWPQVVEYLLVLFTSEGKTECDKGRRVTADPALTCCGQKEQGRKSRDTGQSLVPSLTSLTYCLLLVMT